MKFGWVISCVLLLAVEGQSAERGKGWYGEMPTLPGDEKFQRIYVEDATLYHEDGSEVALWGVNFQSAMSWEWAVSRRKGYEAILNQELKEHKWTGALTKSSRWALR